MRTALCNQLVARAKKQPNMVFLTGDLGFMALEPLRDTLGERFINCGVAEQNMMSVAAALAKEGMEVWAYSIAPFCYARPFEQIRNDICMHNLPVRLLGNGGGYGYGVMGSTHHALEDYGILLTLNGIHVYAPAFDEDVANVISHAAERTGTSYIRLGIGTPGIPVPAYAPWRQLTKGNGPVVITAGPLGGYVQQALTTIEKMGVELWLVCELPIHSNPPPLSLANRLKNASLCVAEEHVAHGGLGTMLCQWLTEQGIQLQDYEHLHASNAPTDKYGSQNYMRKRNGLDQDSIRATLQSLVSEDIKNALQSSSAA